MYILTAGVDYADELIGDILQLKRGLILGKR
jgi:hypothetical protein